MYANIIKGIPSKIPKTFTSIGVALSNKWVVSPLLRAKNSLRMINVTYTTAKKLSRDVYLSIDIIFANDSGKVTKVVITGPQKYLLLRKESWATPISLKAAGNRLCICVAAYQHNVGDYCEVVVDYHVYFGYFPHPVAIGVGADAFVCHLSALFSTCNQQDACVKTDEHTHDKHHDSEVQSAYFDSVGQGKNACAHSASNCGEDAALQRARAELAVDVAPRTSEKEESLLSSTARLGIPQHLLQRLNAAVHYKLRF